jgi:mannose-6-phosphate isomerase-like protein (cupin superfamily)
MNRIFVSAMCAVAFVLPAQVVAQAKPAEYHSAAGLKQQFAKLAADAKATNSGSTGADWGSYENHALKLSYRRATGQAEVHVHLADIMVVTGGAATIVTGGTLVDPNNDNPNELKGESIKGGTRQVLSEGDIIHIPAGTPHQLILDQGKDFQAFVVKIHD